MFSSVSSLSKTVPWGSRIHPVNSRHRKETRRRTSVRRRLFGTTLLALFLRAAASGALRPRAAAALTALADLSLLVAGLAWAALGLLALTLAAFAFALSPTLTRTPLVLARALTACCCCFFSRSSIETLLVVGKPASRLASSRSMPVRIGIRRAPVGTSSCVHRVESFFSLPPALPDCARSCCCATKHGSGSPSTCVRRRGIDRSVFAFLSGLYFRGKLAYARRFAAAAHSVGSSPPVPASSLRTRASGARTCDATRPCRSRPRRPPTATLRARRPAAAPIASRRGRGRAARVDRDRQVRRHAARDLRCAAALSAGLRGPRRHEPRRACSCAPRTTGASYPTCLSPAPCGTARARRSSIRGRGCAA